MRNATRNLIALSAAGLASIAGLTTTVGTASAAPATYQLVGQPSVVEKNTTTTMYAPMVVSGDHAAPTVVSLAIIPMGDHPATAADFDQAMAFNVVVPPHVQGVQVPVQVKGDAVQEADETFRLQITGLSQPGGIGAPVTATIKNDDLPFVQPEAEPDLPDDKAPMPQDDPEEPQDKAPVPQPTDDPAPAGPKAEKPAVDEPEATQPEDDATTPEIDEADLPVAETSTTVAPREDRDVEEASDEEAAPVAEDEAGFPMALALGLGLGAAAVTGGVIIARRRRTEPESA